MIIALVHNWPGVKNSEWDIILRIQSILDEYSIESSITDPLGNILGEDTKKTGVAIGATIVPDLVLNFHYSNPRYISSLSYVVNWNPLAYITDNPSTQLPSPLKHLSYYVDCLRSHDRVLSAGSVRMDDFAEAARNGVCTSWLEPVDLTLHTTISSEGCLGIEGLLPDDVKVFYIGVNWEKVSTDKGKNIRHDGLFELLDKSSCFEFYGLETLHGVSLWDGINSYKGELPFDGGLSIVKESSRCGISLILSSEAHRESELVSTRIFQACKAGSVILTDRNPFIEKHFGDSVFYFDYGTSPQSTASNILEQVAYIKNDWDKSCLLAHKAQQIFAEKFPLEKEVHSIVLQAQRDIEQKQLYIEQLASSTVYVLFYCETYCEQQFTEFVTNVSNQKDCTLKVIIGGTAENRDSILSFFGHCQFSVEYQIVPKGYSLGYLLCGMKQRAYNNNDHFLVYSPGFLWHDDHLFQLLSLSETKNYSVCNAPLFIAHQALDTDSREIMEFFIEGMDGGFSLLNQDTIESFDWACFPLGNILLRCSLLSSHLERSRHFLVQQLGLASVFAILLGGDKQALGAIGNVPRITAEYQCQTMEFNRFEFDEYAYLLEGEQTKQRDRNMLVALLRYVDGIDVHRLDLQASLWEATSSLAGDGLSTTNTSFLREIVRALPAVGAVNKRRREFLTLVKGFLRSYPRLFVFVKRLRSVLK